MSSLANYFEHSINNILSLINFNSSKAADKVYLFAVSVTSSIGTGSVSDVLPTSQYVFMEPLP